MMGCEVETHGIVALADLENCFMQLQQCLEYQEVDVNAVFSFPFVSTKNV